MTHAELIEANCYVLPVGTWRGHAIGCVAATDNGLLYIAALADDCKTDGLTKMYCQQYLKWPPIAAALERLQDAGRGEL